MTSHNPTVIVYIGIRITMNMTYLCAIWMKIPVPFHPSQPSVCKAANQGTKPKLSSSQEEESSTTECALALDLVLHGWLLWGVPFLRVLLVSVIGKVVSGG